MMKALTKDEIAFLLDEHPYYPQPEWVPRAMLSNDDRKYRTKYHAMRDKLVRRGFVKITKPGFSVDGSYQPAEWDVTPLATQIVGLLRASREAHRLLVKMQDTTKTVLGLFKD